MADPAFYNVPADKLTDKMYAKNLLKFISPLEASFKYKSVKMISRESGSTTHLSAVDIQGNVVALTQSINYWFGSGITVDGTGILLNNHLADFSDTKGQPNSIEPFKRPVSSIAPTIVLKNDKPFLTIGTPGGPRIISALAQIIINIIDFNMGIDAAIEAARIHTYGGTLHAEGRITAETVSQLEKLGHIVKVRSDFDNYFGGAQGIMIDSETRMLYGGADSRRDGVAAGY
jgi:gamma-glutamyltranspeptidase/glutathione hydrolase